MFRLWGKIFKDNRLLKDIVIENASADMTRTKKIFAGLEEICRSFDLALPVWLDNTAADFKRHSKARFYQDNFIEKIDFDFLEISVLEED